MELVVPTLTDNKVADTLLGMNPALKFFFAIFFTLTLFIFRADTVFAAAATTPGTEVCNPSTPGSGCDLTSNNFNYFINGQTTLEGSIGHSIFCALLGISPFNHNQCLGYTPDIPGQSNGGKPMVYNGLPSGGAIGSVGHMMAMMYEAPPTSSTEYLADLGQSLGVVPTPAYAQSDSPNNRCESGISGSGSGVICPVLELWKGTRNIAYVVFIIVFVAIGFMIMFRQKINPQTVISIQAALPSLVIGLILVTFSYFIAALLIDLMYLAMNIVAQIFMNASQNGLANALGTDLKGLAGNVSVLSLYSSTGMNTESIKTAFAGTSNQLNTTLGPLGVIIPAVIGGIAGAMLGPIGAIGGAAVGGSAGALATTVIVPTIVILVLLIALFIQAFRLTLALINAYIQILVFTILGPLYILMGSIPGRGGSISSWWKGILGNVMIFPAVFACFLFAGAILGRQTVVSTTIPFFGGVSGDAIKALLGYGILLGIPAVPDMVRKAFGVSGPQGFAQAAIGAASAGYGVARGATNKVFEPYRKEAQGYKEAVVRNKFPTGAAPTSRNWYKIFG